MFEILPHTGDVRVRVAAASLEVLFAEAVRALMFVLRAEPDPDAPTTDRHVVVGSADRTTLLVDFLNEILGLSCTRRESFSDVRFRAFGADSLDANLSATPALFGDEIKAVTYHEAEIIQSADGSWSTLLVFDL